MEGNEIRRARAGGTMKDTAVDFEMFKPVLAMQPEAKDFQPSARSLTPSSCRKDGRVPM